MDARSTPKNPGPSRGRSDRPPTETPRRKARAGDRPEVNVSIAKLIAERRKIRRLVATGTGISPADDDRIRAIDAAIDGLWADVRRHRLPLPQVPIKQAARR